MKSYLIFFSCLCYTLAITVHYDTSNIGKTTKEYKTSLKDIRLVPINEVQPQQKPEINKNQPKIFTSSVSPSSTPQINSRTEKKKFTPRVGKAQTGFQGDETHQRYMQKMADQLYIAQKHASLLSDYQKYIINQDPHAKAFVLGQTTQNRNPKPFSRTKTAKALQVKVTAPTSEPETVASSPLKRIVVVTPKTVKTSAGVKDYAAQSTDLQYVTLSPHYVQTYESPKSLVSYTPHPYTYYDLAVTQKPQIEAVHVPTTLSLSLGAYASPQYGQEDSTHNGVNHHTDPKYEFMYKVKDQEKNNHFGHAESRTDKATYGYYFVHLPDGRLETVKYWADKTGYHAKVDYEGEAKHPPTSEYKLHNHHNIGFH